MSEHSYGWLSLLPPLTAIALAIATRRVLVSLLSGILIAALILKQGHPLATLVAVCEQHLWVSLIDPDHLRVFAFTALMGAMVGVMQAAGGMTAIIRRLAPWAGSRRGGQLTVWALGLIVFFDDYANSLLLGNTMRPLTDRLRISREKLAYLVDSTAAPVSGLALISTWIAGEIGFIREGLQSLPLQVPVDGFDIFLETIPYRFYVLGALLLVPLVALLDRDLGPMWRAERRALQQGPPEDDVERKRTRAAGIDAVLPVLTVVVVTLVLIMFTGWSALDEAQRQAAGLMQIFGNGDSYLALLYGALAGFLTSLLLVRLRGSLEPGKLKEAALSGARHVLPALTILWLAWTLSRLTDNEHLQTGQYLAEMLERSLDVRWLPTAVFLVAAGVSFATGTSWGTMGILMPLVVAVTYQMLAGSQSDVSPHDPLMIATIGSVLAGAIFGDHCSPISDTTVLSSQASGCDHIAHVRTQLPYALLVAGVSILCGTIPVGYGFSVWWLLPLGLAALVGLLWLLGKPVHD